MLLWVSNLILTDRVIVRKVEFGGEFHGVQVGWIRFSDYGYLPMAFFLN